MYHPSQFSAAGHEHATLWACLFLTKLSVQPYTMLALFDCTTAVVVHVGCQSHQHKFISTFQDWLSGFY